MARLLYCSNNLCLSIARCCWLSVQSSSLFCVLRCEAAAYQGQIQDAHARLTAACQEHGTVMKNAELWKQLEVLELRSTRCKTFATVMALA